MIAVKKFPVWCAALLLGLVAGAAGAEDNEHGRSLFELCSHGLQFGSYLLSRPLHYLG